LARTIYVRCIYGIFGREITVYTVIYGLYIQFWPTLYMMVSVGLGEFRDEASIAHHMSHASFKAGLFLAAGVVITSSGGYQKGLVEWVTAEYLASRVVLV